MALKPVKTLPRLRVKLVVNAIFNSNGSQRSFDAVAILALTIYFLIAGKRTTITVILVIALYIIDSNSVITLNSVNLHHPLIL